MLWFHEIISGPGLVCTIWDWVWTLELSHFITYTFIFTENMYLLFSRQNVKIKNAYVLFEEDDYIRKISKLMKYLTACKPYKMYNRLILVFETWFLKNLLKVENSLKSKFYNLNLYKFESLSISNMTVYFRTTVPKLNHEKQSRNWTLCIWLWNALYH